MPRAQANQIELEYDSFGSERDPTFLLIMGFTLQKQAWNRRFCELLAARGYRVVRFDNRDVGGSTRITARVFPNIQAIMAGDLSSVSYGLEDMARDAVGLLDALGIARAHVVGVSMGGMIAQVMATDFASRVHTLTSIMSTTGNRRVGHPTLAAMSVLFSAPPIDRAGYIARAVEVARVIGSRSLPTDDEVVRARAGEAYDRGFFPVGAARQFAALLAASDRTESLHAVRAPALVLHGTEDPLVALDGGEATAQAIPGARFVPIEAMGHDLPEPLWPQLIELLVAHARAGEREDYRAG